MLEGKLVRLRALEKADVEREYRWINDQEVTQYLAARYPMSMTQEEEFIERQSRPGYSGLALAIETKKGEHIGNISLVGPTHPEERMAPLGIMLGEREYWSRGYGTDAIRTLLAFAFQEMNLNRVWLQVHEDNARAIACYKKCGFVEEGRLRQHWFKGGHYHDMIAMGILRGEFEE